MSSCQRIFISKNFREGRGGGRRPGQRYQASLCSKSGFLPLFFFCALLESLEVIERIACHLSSNGVFFLLLSCCKFPFQSPHCFVKEGNRGYYMAARRYFLNTRREIF